MKRGVLIIAMGHPYYGLMALNLAASLKFSCPEVSITLVWSGNGIRRFTDEYKKFFDHIIEAPVESYTRNGKIEYIKAKTWMYDFSPYDETIFLDADILWLPHRGINLLFDELKKVNLTFSNRGSLDISGDNLPEKYSVWTDINEVKKEYKLKEGRYYQLHSEFVYFKKKAKIKKFFDTAKEVYDNLKVKNTMFAGAIPDELPFSIACLLNNIYPHEENYIPIYWEVAEKKNLPGTEMYKQYFAYSTGGSYHTNGMKKFYNNLAKFYCNKTGIPQLYLLVDKRSYLTERGNM